jgi:MYXO-CTERM domain-containing protein
MNVGHGLRALLGGLLAACLGVGCAEEKSAPTDATRRATAPLTGTPFQVRDLRPGSQPDSFLSRPTMFVALGGTVLFGATDKVHGRELWRTDGTAAGTSLVLDLLPGPFDSDPSHGVVMNGRVYFLAAAAGESRSGLWSTDGTAEGTVLVNSLLGQGTFLVQRDGALYIGTTDPDRYSAGFALWRSDGTPEGTVRLRREYAETGAIGGHSAVVLGDRLLFIVTDGTHGNALWTSDGTGPGTRLLKDPRPGLDFLGSFGLAVCGAQAFFWTERDFGRYALWRTDGTEAGTSWVRDVNTADPDASGSHFVSRLVCLGNAVYFSNWDAEVGTELWKSDGSEAGTVRVADLFAGSGGSFPRGFTLHAGAVYFVAEDAEAGTELWKTDGTPQGTRRVADVAPGTAGSTAGRPENAMISSPDGLFFLADDGVHGRELWKTDGTAAGTVRLSNNTSTRFGFQELQGLWSQGALHFWSQDDELWRSTGTAQGTGRVAALARYVSGSLSGAWGRGVDLEGTLYFSADDTGAGERLWRSDGTSAGTILVGGSATSLQYPTYLTRLGGVLLVAANEPEGTRALWSVGTGTQAPRRLASVDLWREEPDLRIATGDGLAYFVQWSFEGDALWKTDGTPEGTVLLRRAARGPAEWHPRLLVAVGTRLYFAASATRGHEELWTSDGTAAGTRRVVGLDAPERRVELHHMVAMNGRLYFWATTQTRGLELWTSDGTAEGTRALGPVASALGRDPGPLNTAVVSGTLFYTVSPRGGPPELWKSDGGAPVKVRTFGATERVGPPVHLTPAGNTLLFWADDGTHGYQPWRSDGSEAGTVMVKALRPGGASAIGGPFTRVSATGPFVFPASDGLSGLELWRTDGTAAGTVRVADIVPGVASSSPTWMATSGPHLFFPAWSPDSGVKLWAMRLAPADTEPPVLTCPPAQVAEAVNAQGAPVSYPPATVTDADPSPTVRYSHASGSVFALGETMVDVTATDGSGNAATCAFSVTVRDTVAPTLECPPSRSAVATSAAGAAVVWPEAVASDAVSSAVTVGYVPERGSVFAVGTTEVTATATDASGNRRSCTFEVRVQAAPGGGTDAGTPDAGSGGTDAGSGGTDAGTSPPPPGDSSGCGCQQPGGAGPGLLGLALLGLLSARRRRV